jgi:serine/threonine protein kinase
LSTLAAGSTLCDGRYRLDAVIGRGGMAIVWRATDLQLERDVAIKVISDVLAGDPSFVARFEREARLAAALNHPNLVKVFDFSVDADRPFLIMEYVAGGTLAERRGQSLDLDALARDLLDAVAHIHAAGILHRDIKPANVLLDLGEAPRLTDFGIARGEETSGLTQPGQVLGTLRYIAPEVAAGEPATVRSDLFGLGVLLGEVTGPRSQALDRLLPRLAARDPHERPASAAEALAELDPTRILEPTRDVEAPATTQVLASEQKPLEQQGGLAPYSTVRGQALRLGSGITRNQALAGVAVLVAVLMIVIVAASSGGGGGGAKPATTTTVRPAAAGAPANQQIDRLEQIVRQARK